MRTSIIIAGILLSANIAASQPPTAGERYQSSRVLTDMPATSVRLCGIYRVNV